MNTVLCLLDIFAKSIGDEKSSEISLLSIVYFYTKQG